ncbi:hypothetical protein ACWCXB_35320 [Streptomyces sp. NPDC001514]
MLTLFSYRLSDVSDRLESSTGWPRRRVARWRTPHTGGGFGKLNGEPDTVLAF